MNKKLNRKVFSSVLALSFVFGGVVTPINKSFNANHNVAYADSLYDIPLTHGFIRTETLEKEGYEFVSMLPDTDYSDQHHTLEVQNGKISYLEAYHGGGMKSLPDKGYACDTFGTYTQSANFLRQHGYEVRQEELILSDVTAVYKAPHVLIWNKIKKDSEENTLSVKNLTVDLNKTPSAEDAVTNKKSHPSNMTYIFTSSVDTSTPGEKKTSVKAIFPDGSSLIKPISITVKDTRKDKEKYTLKGKIQKIVDGETPDPKGNIANLSDQPKGTTYEYAETPDVSLPENSDSKTVSVSIKAIYPDGSFNTLDSSVSVRAAKLGKEILDEDAWKALSEAERKKFAEVKFVDSKRNPISSRVYVKKGVMLREGLVKAPNTLAGKKGYEISGWKLDK
ncbi:Rib/alpha-like domain-containing protein (plasmid) [Anaerococcus martiniensis]|uniref:Rib/alpha-like domain-containing protein n=1 Tax=Anaerococcus sp. WGS1579 TaxID=3366809 RepID=UPI00372D2CA5